MGGAARIATRSTRAGFSIAHSSACIPPIEPPISGHPPVDAEPVREFDLRGDLVADGQVREAGAPFGAVWRKGGRPGAALAAAEHVRRDHEKPVGVDGQARSDDSAPPAGGLVPGAG